MTQPPGYTRQADFTGWSEEHPTTPHQGVAMDAEFNAIVVSVASIVANIGLIQRDDGALRNGSVGLDTISGGVLALINAANGIAAGAWVTGHAYAAGTNWVSQGTGTYMCAVSHTAGTFATDLAAGKWVLIFDTGGTTPANGSVTTAKIADGAVTLAKLALTLLDLTGTIRAQGGLAAGTASVGELLSAKKATGDVLVKAQRTTQAQGIVGFRIQGGTSGISWDVRQSASADALELYDSTAVRVAWTGPLMDVAGRVRATGDATPAAGAGIGMRWAASIGYVDAYDHDASAWRPAYYRSSVHRVYCGAVLVVDASSTGVNFPAGASVAGRPAGFLGIPKNAQDGAYTLAAADAGHVIYSENSAGQTVTIPLNATVDIPEEFVCAVRNRGTNPIIVSPFAGVTLRWGSSGTGARTVSVGGFACLYQEKPNQWVITGSGVS